MDESAVKFELFKMAVEEAQYHKFSSMEKAEELVRASFKTYKYIWDSLNTPKCTGVLCNSSRYCEHQKGRQRR